MRLKGKVALITGGGTGIGRAIALSFAKEGARVVITGRRQGPLEETVSELKRLGGEGSYCCGDVSLSRDAQAMVKVATKLYGKLDVLINNAGVVRRNERIIDLEEKDWDEHMAINMKSVYLMCKYAIPKMIENGGGSIVNIASMLGFVAALGYGCYCAAKGAIISFTRSLALDYAQYGIRANCVCPGLVRTQLAYVDRENFDELLPEIVKLYPLGRVGSPEDIAPAVVYFASDESSWVTGQMLIIDGGYTIR